MACIGEIKAIFWARGVENIYIEQPVEQYRVLESSEGYWIGHTHLYINRIDEVVEGSGMGLFLIGGHLLKILPQNSKGAS